MNESPENGSDQKGRLPYRDTAEASRIYITPNLLTAGNMFCGFLAVIWCIRAKHSEVLETSNLLFTQAVLLILGAFVFDAFDGRVARTGGKESLFGKEFDSIADVISFGMAPALMVFFMILDPSTGYEFFRVIGWAVGFIFLACAGVRLARFNVLTNPFIPGSDEHNKAKDFVGLPAPAAAAMIASLVLVLQNLELKGLALGLPLFMLLVAFLMVSEIPYPSFKHIDREHLNLVAFLGVVFGLVLLFSTLRENAFAVLFSSYILYGLFRHLHRKNKIRKQKSSTAKKAS